MSSLAQEVGSPPLNDSVAEARMRLAPRPRTVGETGLSETFIAELVAKHLYDGGVLDLRQLSARTSLSGTILETALGFLRSEAWIEVRRSNSDSVGLRYLLTDRGRAAALDALTKSGYVGPAPVPLGHYVRVVHEQSIHKSVVTEEAMKSTFSDVVIRNTLLNQLGPAVHSGRAIFVYGASGTGKTYISRRLARLLGQHVLIPYAIAVDETVVQIFDPLLHHAADESVSEPNVMLEQGHDPRFVLCRRPVVISGGELTIDMLEVRYDTALKLYHAPLQLKASNGMYLIDDLGRQRVATVDLLNRWIVPMEERKDFLSLGAGQHFEVPFDVLLIFSTNIDPLELADEAFLRRMGYKIRFDYVDTVEYEEIWRQVCREKGMPFDPEVLRYVLEELHAKRKVPLLPCHPRDLLSLAEDHCRYQGKPNTPTIELMRWAWDNYFIELGGGKSSQPQAVR